MKPSAALLAGRSPVDAKGLDRFRTDLYRFIRRKGFNREEADDLTQETLLRAYTHMEEFRSTHLAAWLYRIAANLCVDHSRKHRIATVPLGEELVGSPDGDPAELLDRCERRRAVRSVMGQLPECHQQILRLRYYEERSMVDIADEIHCTPLAAKLRVFRAVNALRKRWRASE
jgi:RNA polymerase sigma-70 factor (ECF subfamily)